MNSNHHTYVDAPSPESIGADALSIALIGPDDLRRKEAATALLKCNGTEVREYSAYPANLDEVPRLLEQRNDVIIIDLDSDPEFALELVESLCANGATTVMVYSSKPDPDLLVRCMRAGAREFLTPPFALNTMAEALVRAQSRRTVTRLPRKTGGRLLVFLGAKGGAGVTTLACNFAVALAQESTQSTLLIDLDLPLGDAALNLGIVTEYSTVNALQEAGRLDASFLNKLLIKHVSGVSVLAAPGKFPQFHATNEAIDKLMTVARQEFDNVVVDVGSRLGYGSVQGCVHDLPGHTGGHSGTAEFESADQSVLHRGQPETGNRDQSLRAAVAGRFRRDDYQGADAAGKLEDSERLRSGAADAEHRNAAGSG